MALLIDGYNLLHVTGLVGRAGSGLQGSREALLRFLGAAVDGAERSETTIVFDAAEAPPGLPRTTTHEGMTVRYASDYEDADALIEELIAASHAPRALTVVSSDHRIQRAAHRRRAPFVDSDAWFADAVRRRGRMRIGAPPAAQREVALTPDEVSYWLREFGDGGGVDGGRGPMPPGAGQGDLENPFPPGYAEDLTDE
jgi:predicted RNA-binding protein with PIN domain